MWNGEVYMYFSQKRHGTVLLLWKAYEELDEIIQNFQEVSWVHLKGTSTGLVK